MWNWENKETSAHGIRYSRYIASYLKIARKLKRPFYYGEFKAWLLSIGVDPVEADEIAEMSDNGKLELETSARQFISAKIES